MITGDRAVPDRGQARAWPRSQVRTRSRFSYHRGMADKKTLLVLEEGATLTRAIKPEVERAGYEVITYRDATGVLVMAKQIAADVMILDAQLRNAGSVSALKSFGRNVHTAAIPIIALVGRTGPKSDDLMAAGARA